MKYLMLALGLIAGNFCYQAMQIEADWLRACDRSFFQALACFCCYMIRDRMPEKPPLEMGDQ